MVWSAMTSLNLGIQQKQVAVLFKDGRLPGLAYVISLWVIGLGAMLAHHLFYAYLNGKSTAPSAAELSTFLRKLGQIDALVRCGQSPFNPSIIRAATASSALFVISLIASAMALVVVFTPGSLTVDSDFHRTRNCTVLTVPAITDPIFEDIGERLEDSTMAIYASGSYFPPLPVDRANACGEGALTCTYNVSFVGAWFDCIDVTKAFNVTQIFSAGDPTSNTPYLIWFFEKAQLVQTPITFSSQDLVKGEAQITNCTVYNATYEVGIESDDSFSAVRVRNVIPDSILGDEDMSFMSQYSHAALDWLKGTVFAGPNGALDASEDGDIRVQDNPFFVITPDGNHTWDGSVVAFLASYMQNVSLSLLSGNIYYGISNDTATNLETINSTCSATFTVYVYTPARLLVAYGVTLALAVATGVYGFWLTMRNGREESPLISHIIRISLNDALFRLSGRLNEDIPVRLCRGSSDTMERLLPTPSVRGNLTQHNSDSSIASSGPQQYQGARTKLNFLNQRSSAERKMTALICLASCCMAIHHVYNHYLNGKVPSFSSASWARDQVIVSDIGLTLAYAAQLSLITSITTASTQVFWHRLRSKALRISQIDALTVVQSNPLGSSSIPALRASTSVLLLALLASSMALVSIFSSSSIKVTPDYSQSEDCTIMVPQNVLAVQFLSNVPDYTAQLNAALTLGSYLPPINPCNLGVGVRCSYALDFIGPGFDCEDVTGSSNSTAFITAGSEPGINWVNQFAAVPVPQTDDLTMQMNVQIYDVPRAEYQAVNCTGVLRTYSTLISHNSSSTINVTESRVISVVRANMTSPPYTFTETYLSQIMSLLAGLNVSTDFGGADQRDGSWRFGKTFMQGAFGTLGNIQLDGNITWQDNMTLALEDLAQNATLSLLSGRMIVPDSNSGSSSTKLLESETQTCTYSFTAYKYTPYRLFLTYGIAIFVTMLCAVWGAYAIRQNGVVESMDFSRILRAILSEEMYSARQDIDEHTMIIARENADGNFVPLVSEAMDEIRM